MIITSAIGICVHEEILNKKKISFLREFLSTRSLRYFFNFLALTLIALSPLLIHFVMRKVLTIQNENFCNFNILDFYNDFIFKINLYITQVNTGYEF